MEAAELLEAYDAQLRREAEVLTATEVTHDGPLVRGRFQHGGFVSYRDLDGLTGTALDALIRRTIAYFRDETDVEDFEWKTRGHDAPEERFVVRALRREGYDVADRLDLAGLGFVVCDRDLEDELIRALDQPVQRGPAGSVEVPVADEPAPSEHGPDEGAVVGDVGGAEHLRVTAQLGVVGLEEAHPRCL